MTKATGRTPDVSVIMVSYNTRALTLRALETLLANAGDAAIEVIVWDNASADGSADAIAHEFPQVQLIAHDENLGFAAANNRAAECASGEYLLLLNPDTETFPGAIDALLQFARANPGAGIVGGRTLYPDGSLNPHSCRARLTVWSLFSSALGLARLFPGSRMFNPEEYGGWARDDVRQVDIVIGCLLLVQRQLWMRLGGFDTRYFMYGEDADLCLRAQQIGASPQITPRAEIMHVVGAASGPHARKIASVLKARITLVRDHWHPLLRPLGTALLWLWAANRMLADRVISLFVPDRERRACWREVWARRDEWMAGY